MHGYREARGVIGRSDEQDRVLNRLPNGDRETFTSRKRQVTGILLTPVKEPTYYSYLL